MAPRLTQVIHKNITLKHCGGVVPFRRGTAVAVAAHTPAKSQPAVTAPPEFVPQETRPLAVLLTWLAAQDKHIEKYRALWMQRGFDVLTVRMTPYQFVLPTLGAHPLVKDLIKFLYAIAPIYPELVLHCFSVGAYEFGEVLHHLNDERFMSTIEWKDGRDPKKTIEDAIRGIVFDSPVSLLGIPSGVARSITANPVAVKVVENSIKTHLKVAYPVATKHYIRASDFAHNNYLTHAPGLMICSNRDLIAARERVENVTNCWRKNGIDVTLHIFEDSIHVQHLTKYPQEYSNEVDKFLKKVKLQTLN